MIGCCGCTELIFIFANGSLRFGPIVGPISILILLLAARKHGVGWVFLRLPLYISASSLAIISIYELEKIFSSRIGPKPKHYSPRPEVDDLHLVGPLNTLRSADYSEPQTSRDVKPPLPELQNSQAPEEKKSKGDADMRVGLIRMIVSVF